MERTESVVEERTTPSSEVLEKPARRRFTVEYKARILAEADACTEPTQPTCLTPGPHDALKSLSVGIRRQRAS